MAFGMQQPSNDKSSWSIGALFGWLLETLHLRDKKSSFVSLEKWQDVTPFAGKAVAYTEYKNLEWLTKRGQYETTYYQLTEDKTLRFGFVEPDFVNPGHPVWHPEAYEENPKPCYSLKSLLTPNSGGCGNHFLNDACLQSKNMALRKATPEECTAMHDAIIKNQAQLAFISDRIGFNKATDKTIVMIKKQAGIE